MYRFNYFTQKASEVLNLAIKAAENLGHNYVGSEHILLGLLKVDGGVAHSVLESRNVTLEDIESFIKTNVGVGNKTRLSPDDFTPRSKRIIDTAFQIARGMLHSFVDTEHLLLAILQEGDSYAVKFINSMGIDEELLFEQIVQTVNNNAPSRDETGAKKGRAGKSKTPTLDEFGKDLTAIAKEGKIDPVIGREKEIERVLGLANEELENTFKQSALTSVQAESKIYKEANYSISRIY